MFWHSIWHLFWHSILAFYLASILTFYSAVLSGIHYGILSGIYSGIYSNILFRRSIWHLFWHSLWNGHCPLRSVARRGEERRWEKEVTLINSRDPHLAGGEKWWKMNFIEFQEGMEWPSLTSIQRRNARVLISQVVPEVSKSRIALTSPALQWLISAKRISARDFWRLGRGNAIGLPATDLSNFACWKVTPCHNRFIKGGWGTGSSESRSGPPNASVPPKAWTLH